MYGQSIPHLSPRFLNATGSMSGSEATITVSFVPETVVDGLQIIPGATCPISQGVAADTCAGFVVTFDSATGPAVNATAAIGPGNTVILSAQAPSAGSVPVIVSSSFSAWPIVTLYSQAGFPALPWNATVFPA